MSEEQWSNLLHILDAQRRVSAQRICVGCWYKDHPDAPFPAVASSSLCSSCAQETRAASSHQRREGSVQEVLL